MYGQLGYMDFIAGIQKKIQEKTGLLCYDTAPENALAPYYMAKIINKTTDRIFPTCPRKPAIRMRTEADIIRIDLTK